MDEEIHGTDVDEMTLHDVVADETVDVEGEAIKYCEICRLKEVLAKLSADELELIKEMYLSDTPLTERAYAERLGISSVAVHKRKTTVLKKIRNQALVQICDIPPKPQGRKCLGLTSYLFTLHFSLFSDFDRDFWKVISKK